LETLEKLIWNMDPIMRNFLYNEKQIRKMWEFQKDSSQKYFELISAMDGKGGFG
jgi:hypothetical protein